MSRTSKKETHLTIEEALNQALVPDVEQPYKIPKNWTWCYLQSFSDISTGKKDANYGSKDGKYYFFTCAADPIRSNGYSFEGKYILLAGNGNISNIQIYDGKFEAYQRTYVLSVNPDIYTEFVYYYFKYRWVDYNIDKMYGTAIPYIRLGNLQFFPVPIAPLAEQQRIVDRIESLFAKLDEAKEKAQEVIDGFDDRRSAILNKAFTGELTSNWNEKFITSSNEWKIKSFDDVAIIKSNLVDPADYQSYPHIAPDNIEKKTGRLLKYNTIAEDGVKSGKHRFYAGQILYSKIRPNLSKVVVIDFDGLCSADMYPIEAKPDVNTKFLWYYMLSDDFVLQASTAGTRSVLPKINQKELSSLKVRVTSLPKQERIVKILDSFFAKEQQAKETAEQVIEQIEVMKKAILARAFRGELGTNDPNDEPAIDLLRRVINS